MVLFKRHHLVRVSHSVVKLCEGFVIKFPTSESFPVLVTKLQEDVCKLMISGYGKQFSNGFNSNLASTTPLVVE